MRLLADYVQYANLVLYTAVAVVAIRHWRRYREQAALWAALTFVALAVAIDAGELLPDPAETTVEKVAERLFIAVLVLFPYLLYRFAVSFRPPGRWLSRVVVSLTTTMVAATFALPRVPEDPEPWPAWFTAYVVAFVIHWTLLASVATFRLWSAGRGESTVARRRMQLLALGATAITLALFVGVFGGDDPNTELATQLLSSLSAFSFLLGLAPPAGLRLVWRRREQERLEEAVADLMAATTHDEVVERVLPRMAAIVGARAVELRDADGEVIGVYGDPGGGDDRMVRLDVPSGDLVVWTSPYAPYFGGEELGLLRALGSLTTLALDRSRLFAHEREARVALERADELKTNFIALAAHELRTPVATVHGLAETIHSRREELGLEQVRELETVMRDQSLRLKQLVEQLLDLSRLEAEVVPIEPEPLPVRARVEELVSATAGERAYDVAVDVPPELVADVDPDAFDRIVSNLIANALRYGAPPVTISAQQNDRHFRLIVEDRGAGVAPEFVPDLFERFTRSERSRERAGGTGLGLSIARSYAQAHRGELLYEPARPHGARFQLVLPVRP